MVLHTWWRRVLVVALVLVGRVAWADDALARARAAMEQSDYPTAQAALAQARDEGGHSPADTAEIYQRSGIVEAALGHARPATDAFLRWLALAPDGSLREGTSPKITRPFDAAKGYFASNPALRVKTESQSQPPAITVEVTDSLAMVARVRVAFVVDGGAEQVREAAASARTQVALPFGKRIDARVAVLDASGNRLIEIGSQDVPIVILGEPARPAPPPPPAPSAHPAPPTPAPASPQPALSSSVPALPAPRAAGPLWRRWWPYASGAVVFAAATGYFALSARSAASDLLQLERDSVHHNFDETKPIEDRGRRDTLLTNIGLGVTGACAAAAVVMYVAAPHVSRETQVVAAPVHGGGVLAIGGAF